MTDQIVGYLATLVVLFIFAVVFFKNGLERINTFTHEDDF